MKILIAGPVHSGKSTYVSLLDQNSLNVEARGRNKEMYTVGIDIGTLLVNDFRVCLFGTPGLLQFSTIRDIISKGSDGVIFFFDAAHPEKDEDAITILGEIRKNLKPEIPIVFLANKQDLEGARPPEVIKAQNKLPKNSKIFPTSCKTGLNVKESLKYIFNEIYKKYESLLELLKEHEEDIRMLAQKLNKNKEEMKDFLNELEIKRFIKIDRINKSYKVLSGSNC
ncbi:MAG: Small GTP-binding domain protein [Promethearchaeota archaeon]|nr:MAG: Small GTP-binding domain protein [Candidatus Lokiarchaeota archaeon]